MPVTLEMDLDGIRERNTDAGAAGLSGRNSDGKTRRGNRQRPDGRGTVPGSHQRGLSPPGCCRWPAAPKRSDLEEARRAANLSSPSWLSPVAVAKLSVRET